MGDEVYGGTGPDAAREILRARSLREGELRARGLVVAEGVHCVARLCASAFPLLGVLSVEPFPAEVLRALGGSDGGADRLGLIGAATEGEMSALAGYPFHRGCIALARRGPTPPPAELPLGNEVGVVALPDLVDAENLGSIARSAQAFGYSALAVGPSCCDPLSRRAARVSMGAVFSLPLAAFASAAELARMKGGGYALVAARLGGEAPERVAAQLRRSGKKPILMLGNEDRGLPGEYLDAADLSVGIPMRGGADSLNVGVAAGVLMYILAEAAR